MDRPFSTLPSGTPPDFVVETLDGVVADSLARVRNLADIMSGGSERTRQAMVTVLESSAHEVAVTSLLTGTNALMLGYRAVLAPLGASLRGQVDVAQAAWREYCTAGYWERPAQFDPPPSSVPQSLIELASPRCLTKGERITAEYTESLINTTADAATNVGKAGSDFFANTLRTPVPSGELTDFLDTATSMHAKVFATMQGALAASLHDYIVSVQSSYQAYRQTGAWANPTVTVA